MPLLRVARRYDVKEWEEIHTFVPDLNYHQIKTKIHFLDNIVGHQQRSFIVHWAVKEHDRIANLGTDRGYGLDIGCGQLVSPYCIGADVYSGSNHPDYGGEYWPHVRCLGEILPFRNESFDFIVSHHSLEHMKDTENTIREWLRVLRREGKIIIVMPDKKWGPFKDRGHVSEHDAMSFKNILDKIQNIRILEHDTFQNNFSYNTVIEKI